jgi:hypothetical protein
MQTSSAPCCLESDGRPQAVRAFESALAAQSVPGTNLRGSAEGANWCFLLPHLELGRVLTLGAPSPLSLRTLSRLGDDVLVWAKSADQDGIRALVAKQGLANVTSLAIERHRKLSLPNDAVDLVFVTQPRLARSPLGEGRARAEIQRVLRPDGRLYAELRSRVNRLLRDGEKEPLAARAGECSTLWIAPAWGEMRLAAPARDRAAIQYMEQRFLKPILRRQVVKRPRQTFARSLLMSRLLGRRALVCTGSDEPAAGPPDYVREIAAQAGAPVDGLRWALAAPGDYRSQKVLLFLFDDDGGARSVVKITRDPGYNPRLENEWRALTLLEQQGIGSPRTRPSPLFLGHHAGLAVLGQTAVRGIPFTQCTQSREAWQHARSVVESLLELGATTSHRPEDPGDVVALLRAALTRFDELYRPAQQTTEFLAEQVEAIADGGDGLRLVFQHGDPGPWNLLLTPEGQPVFLDWEAADPEGLPLWDLFHFLRSFGLSIPQRRRRDPLRCFADQMLGTSELNRVLVDATDRYCVATALSPRLVEPLFFLCWVHRAIKEASRLPLDRLQSGRYLNILRLAIERRDAPGLQRLFSLAATD